MSGQPCPAACRMTAVQCGPTAGGTQSPCHTCIHLLRKRSGMHSKAEQSCAAQVCVA